MYYPLLIKRFLRSYTTWVALALLLGLGLISLGIGHQHLRAEASKIEEAHRQQREHIERHVGYHPNDIGLLMYYLRFCYINPTEPIAGLAIGQGDIAPSVQHIKMLGLEGQRYDTDLVNPVQLQVGNLDLSFVVIFLFPLVIIALCFNLLHEEVERGTWRMIRVQGLSPARLYLSKLSLPLMLVYAVLLTLFALGAYALSIPLDASYWGMLGLSAAYLLFWFALCFALVSFQLSGGANAVILLTLWLLMVGLIPVGLNNYVTARYPVGEALSLTVRQRDEYHKRWDTDKQATMDLFYQHYPQFAHYPLQKEGFSWLWYYAMQQMGDDESLQERNAMFEKIRQRQKTSMQLSSLLPPVQIQLSMSSLARTDLGSYVDFLEGTSAFHEGIRLDFYPRIFDDVPSTSVPWEQYVPQYHQSKAEGNLWAMMRSSLLYALLLLAIGAWRIRRL